MTALGATCIDDGAAATSLHADQKTMSTLAAGNGRLIGTFHFLLPFHKERAKKALKKPLIRRVYPPLCQGMDFFEGSRRPVDK